MPKVVKCTLPHARSLRVAGVSGVVYIVCPNTMTLCVAREDDSMDCDSGVSEEDAARFRQFEGFEVIEPVSAATPPSPRVSPAPKQAPAVPSPESLDSADQEADDNSQLSPEFDASILDVRVGILLKSIKKGEHDAHLPALLAAEKAGKARKGLIKSIQDRINRG